MDLTALTAIIRCRRLRRLRLNYAAGLTPADLVLLLDLLWGLYGGGPFAMVLDAGAGLQQEARAVAVRKGWCAEGWKSWDAIELRW